MARIAGDWERIVAEIAAEPGAARFADPGSIILAWSVDGDSVLWSSRAGAALRARLAAPDGAVRGLTDVARGRLGALGHGLAPRQGFRLERLRLGARQLDPLVTLACRLVATPDGDALLTAALDGVSEDDRRLDSPPDVLEPAAPRETDGAPEPSVAAVPAASAEPEPAAEPPRHKGLRFTWQTDREGRFTTVSGQLAEAVGEPGGDLVGRRWSDLVGRIVHDGGHVGRALEGAVPWSRREVAWLDPERGLMVPVEISGAPLRRPTGHLDGYRGYGTAFPEEARPAQPGGLTGVLPEMARGDAAPPLAASPSAGIDPEAPLSTALDAAAALTGTASETMLGVLRAWFVPQGGGGTAPPTGSADGDGRERAGTSALPGPANTNGPETLTGAERGALTEIARALGDGVPAAAGALPAPPPDDEGPRPGQHVPSNPASLLDALPVGIVVVRHRTPLYANPHLLALVGQPDLPSLVASGGLDDLLARETDGRTSEGVQIAVSGGARADLALDVRFAPVAWGDLPAALAIVSPAAIVPAPVEPSVADRVEALEHALSAEAERSAQRATALDVAADGALVLDGTARIVSANEPARRCLGRDDDGLVGDTLASILVPEDHWLALGTVAGLRDRPIGTLKELEVRARQRGRAPRPLWMRIGVVGRDGEAAVLSVTFRDASETHAMESDLRDARREAERASENRAEFLARISHEIRTPLTAITGFAELILGERFGPLENERYRSYLRDIHQSSGHVLSLVNDLLDLAKVTSGHSELTPVSVDLNTVVQQCIALSTPIAARERTILRTSFPSGLPAVFADERSVRQIVINVLSNAIRFTGAGGQVIVSTAAGGRGEVLLSIRDTGPGMSEKDIEAALTPFRRVSASQRRDGTGLGLPLSKALVEANGGAFEITSAPKAGTLVEIRLPIAALESVAAE